MIVQLPEDGDIFFVNACLLLDRFRRNGPIGVLQQTDTCFVLLSNKDSAVLVSVSLPIDVRDL